MAAVTDAQNASSMASNRLRSARSFDSWYDDGSLTFRPLGKGAPSATFYFAVAYRIPTVARQVGRAGVRRRFKCIDASQNTNLIAALYGGLRYVGHSFRFRLSYFSRSESRGCPSQPLIQVHKKFALLYSMSAKAQKRTFG